MNIAVFASHGGSDLQAIPEDVSLMIRERFFSSEEETATNGASPAEQLNREKLRR